MGERVDCVIVHIIESDIYVADTLYINTTVLRGNRSSSEVKVKPLNKGERERANCTYK